MLVSVLRKNRVLGDSVVRYSIGGIIPVWEVEVKCIPGRVYAAPRLSGEM